MRVQISIPSLDTCPIDFALSLAALCATNTLDRARDRRTVSISIAHCAGSLVMDARNQLVAKAQETGATHLLFLDSDMAFPPDTLNRLIAHNKPVVGATYVKRYPPHEILGNAAPSGIPLGVLHPMLTLPLGCMLIDLKVFASLARPYFKYLQGDSPSNTQSEDTYFCNTVRAAGFTIYLDRELTREIGHVGSRVFRPSDTLQLQSKG